MPEVVTNQNWFIVPLLVLAGIALFFLVRTLLRGYYQTKAMKHLEKKSSKNQTHNQ